MTIELKTSPDLDKDNIPIREGKYLAIGVWGDRDNPRIIDVYEHPIKSLVCFSEDYGGDGYENDDETGCHVSVRFTGLKFISRVGDLK